MPQRCAHLIESIDNRAPPQKILLVDRSPRTPKIVVHSSPGHRSASWGRDRAGLQCSTASRFPPGLDMLKHLRTLITSYSYMDPLLEHEHENRHERGLLTIDTDQSSHQGCVKSRRPRQRSGTVPARNRRPAYHSLTHHTTGHQVQCGFSEGSYGLTTWKMVYSTGMTVLPILSDITEEDLRSPYPLATQELPYLLEIVRAVLYFPRSASG
jgi:hypothetical protein